jgi:predicted Zn-dependent protease
MLHRDHHFISASFWKYVVVLLSLALCAGRIAASSELPSLGENSVLNIERETRLGRSVYERLLEAGAIETNPLLDRYINDLGYRLLAGIENRSRDYHFFIVRDDSVNAFALPGGYIGVNRGLIHYAQTQHQLASVMAHEIAHVELRHGMDMMAKSNEVSTAAVLSMVAGILLGTANPQAGSAVMFGGVAGAQQAMVNYTRENEYEADRVGIELLSNANFDTNGMVEFFTIMGKLSGNSEIGGIEYLRTHPLSNSRIAEAMARVRNLPGSGDQIDDYPLFKDYLLYISSDHMPQQGSPYLRALATMKSGNYQLADPMLRALYDDDNENIWYVVAYGENLEYLRRYTDAEQVYRHLLAIFPGDYVLSMRLLNVLSVQGRYQAALQVARRMEIDYPQRQQVYFALSLIYDALNQPVQKMMAEAEFHRLTGNARQSIRLYDQVLASADADPTTVSIAREKRLQLMEQEKKAD